MGIDELDHALVLVQFGDPEPGFVPGVKDDHFDVLKVVPSADIAVPVAERGLAQRLLDQVLALVWKATESIYLWGGYEFSQWENAVGTDLFPDDVHEGYVQSDTADVVWDGFSFGAGMKF